MLPFLLLSIIFLLSLFLLICSNQYFYYDKKHSSPKNKFSYSESTLYKDIQLFFNDTFEYKKANERNGIIYAILLASLIIFFVIYFINIFFFFMSNTNNTLDTTVFIISLSGSFIILIYLFRQTEFFKVRNKSFL